ncbi:MAG TPA: F0F1 ATP synthase subunit A [Candidatus Latescibacteria bacterium]|nr:F0F1 ATP synthase subunit A [Candidatus Latescibacterota bacterium]
MTKRRKLLLAIVGVLAVEVALALKAKPEIEIGAIPQCRFSVGGHELVLNSRTAIMTWLVMAIWTGMALAVRMRLREVPGRLQAAFEFVVEFFDGLISDTLGPDNRAYLPWIGSLFLFIWLSNIIGVVPGLEEPTRDLNVPVGCMLVVLAMVHASAIRKKGLKGYIKGYMQPFALLLPLNVIGEIAKGVSLAFRLFGNIMGGAIIFLVVSSLVRYVLIPVGLNLFFGLFVGTVQAFVFTMLALAYTAVAVSD